MRTLPSLGNLRIQNPGVIRGFNPQPEPPKQKGFVNPGSLVGFNPQPDPPGTPWMLPSAKQ